jgi:DnaJ-like protein
MERPFVKYRIWDLENFIERYSDDFEKLIKVYEELKFRKTNRANNLQNKVKKLLSEKGEIPDGDGGPKHSPKGGKDFRIFPCLCGKKLRIIIKSKGTIKVFCPICSAESLVIFDENDNLIIKYQENIKDNEFDPYDVLEVPIEATFEQIRNAYMRKCKAYHPDKVANLGSKLKDIAEKEMKRINEAFEILKSQFEI